MSMKTVQQYLWLNDLVPELKKVIDVGKLSFTPTVEIFRSTIAISVRSSKLTAQGLAYTLGFG